MSDVTVSVVENNTLVTVSGDVVDISVTENPVTVTTGTSGPQGATGVIAATAPITYNSGTQTVAINQAGLTLTQSQVTSLVSDLAGKASLGAANAFTVGGHVITNAATAVVPLVLKGASSQSASLTAWQDSAGTVLSAILSNGRSAFPRTSVGSSVDLGYGTLSVAANSSTTVGAVIRGAASQSANLQEWQNSAGTVLASVSSGGNILGSQIRTISSSVLLTETSAGGGITMLRSTSANINPGTNFGRLYFRDGTTLGTLKLVVRAGAAGAETTILDNIPT